MTEPEQNSPTASWRRLEQLPASAVHTTDFVQLEDGSWPDGEVGSPIPQADGRLLFVLTSGQFAIVDGMPTTTYDQLGPFDPDQLLTVSTFRPAEQLEQFTEGEQDA